jgi:putative flippase GtrA
MREGWPSSIDDCSNGRLGWRSAVRRFAHASAAAFAANLGVTMLLHEMLGVAPAQAYAVALAVVFVQSFLFLRFYVYGRQNSPWLLQFLKYAPSTAAFRGFEFLAFFFAEGVLGIDYRVAIVLIAGLSLTTKFLFYRQVVFRG